MQLTIYALVLTRLIPGLRLNPLNYGDTWRLKRGRRYRRHEPLREAKKLAQKYRALTGKPLGITGEVAEYEAVRILGLELTVARQAGYDAIEKRDGTARRLQIKGRCLLPGCEPGQRLGSIDIAKDWDSDLTFRESATLDPTIGLLQCPPDRFATSKERSSYASNHFCAGVEA